ncbi:MAG TPA: hypothetical protein DIW54_00920 [Chitinophagaceae bacterium]|nr:hypothetical protein [Chitinophagaceae bacterium]HCT21965.1 hypothetical protein [Chitinophagaceae bacterium]
MMKHIACNLIYNDGNENSFVGFNGRCSIQNIIYNVKKNSSRWCNQKDCSCYKFYNSGFKSKAKDYPCNESRVFSNWEWSAGAKFKDKEAIKMRKVGQNKIAILTTCFANTDERDRKIVGFFKIESINDENNLVTASKEYRIKLTVDEAKQMNFWSYYQNPESPKKIVWSQPRFRYLDDIQIAAILHDLLFIVSNAKQKSTIRNLLQTDFTDYFEVRPQIPCALKVNNVINAALQKKYGKGGESKEHKKLKEFVAENPERIGIRKIEVKPFIEHPFVSGDIVDILFEPINNGINTVVEIELDNVIPGIHQAIKYRALRCSQLGLELTDKKVKAIVVAWTFKEDEKKLCEKYNIDYYEIKL